MKNIILLDTGILEEQANPKRRLFLTENEDLVVAPTHINKPAKYPEYKNKIMTYENIEYILPVQLNDIILDFDPSYEVLEELKVYCANIYLWEDMDTSKIKNLNLSNQ